MICRMSHTAAVAVLFLTGCSVSLNTPENQSDIYPDLPDNEYCFRKIAEYRQYIGNPDYADTTVQILPDGGKKLWRTITPKESPEAYWGILEGRHMIRRHQIVVSARQCHTFFMSLSENPDFVVEVIGSWNADPSQYRIITIYYKPENENKLLEWLEKRIPSSTRPKCSPRALFLERNPDCILLEPVSPALIEYVWTTRQGDIGQVEGLEKRMAKAPAELIKYIAQMRKWAEWDQKIPFLFSDEEEWEKFRLLSKTNASFYAIFRTKSIQGIVTNTEIKSFLLLLDENAKIVWKLPIESRRLSISDAGMK